MKSKLFIGIFFILSLIISCTSTSNNTEKSGIIIKDVNIITMTNNQILENKSVYIYDGLISQIGNFDDLQYPKDTSIIDAKGKYLTPGFSDMHVHTYEFEDFSLYLANGITTVRNMWGYPEHIRRREMINNGELLGPQLFTAGPLTDGKNSSWPGSYLLTDVDKVEEYVINMKNEGYDSIKIYDKLSKEVFIEIMKFADKYNIPVIGHTPYNVDIETAINSNLHSIEHFNGYNLHYKNIDDLSETIDLTVESGIWNCPTLVVMKRAKDLINRSSKPEYFTKKLNPHLKYVNPQALSWWQGFNGIDNGYEMSKNLLSVLNNRGANIVSGTDHGNPYVVPGFSLHEEFELMNEAGLTPYEVLLTTTINPAKMMGIEDKAGTIEVGKSADLILLDKNPLLDIKNTKTINGVIVKGLWLDRIRLDEMLNEVKLNFSK